MSDEEMDNLVLEASQAQQNIDNDTDQNPRGVMSQDMFNDVNEDNFLPSGQKHLRYVDPQIRSDFGLGQDDEESGDDEEEEEKEKDSGDESESEEESEKDDRSENGDLEVPEAEHEVLAEEIDESGRNKENDVEGERGSGGSYSNGNKKIINGKDEQQDDEVESKTEKEVLKWLEEKKKEKSKLTKEIKELDKQLQEAQEFKAARKARMDTMTQKIKKQEKEIKKQKALMKKKEDGPKRSIYKDMFKGLEERAGRMEIIVDELNNNTKRLLLGRCGDGGRDELEIKSLERIREWDGRITIFCPTENPVKTNKVKQEMKKLENLRILPFVESGLADLVKKINEFSQEGRKEKNMAVFILNWVEGYKIEDEALRELALENFIGALKIAVNRGEKKFGKVYLVLPPATEENCEVVEGLCEKVVQYFKECNEIISLMQLQEDLGMAWKEEEGKVWSNRGVVRAKIFCEDDEERCGAISEYAVRRVISEMANKWKEGELDNICYQCGFAHSENCCIELAQEKVANLKELPKTKRPLEGSDDELEEEKKKGKRK